MSFRQCVSKGYEVQDRGDLFVTPKGSNDDWYWLYGTVAARQRGVLVSNDKMRDHHFELLRPKYFIRWRHHHQYEYQVLGSGLHGAGDGIEAEGADAVEQSATDTDAVVQQDAQSQDQDGKLKVVPSQLEIVPPQRFTTCVQQVAETGAWMIPLADDRWLCARPHVAASSASAPVTDSPAQGWHAPFGVDQIAARRGAGAS